MFISILIIFQNTAKHNNRLTMVRRLFLLFLQTGRAGLVKRLTMVIRLKPTKDELTITSLTIIYYLTIVKLVGQLQRRSETEVFNNGKTMNRLNQLVNGVIYFMS
jgi:hypothetical protein